MFKILFSIIFSLCIFSLTEREILCMPGAEEEAVEAAPSDDAVPVAPEPTAAPAQATPASPQPATPPSSEPQPAAGTPEQAQPATPAEEVKPEKLGEFEIQEDLPSTIKNIDPKVIELIRKSNDISKQINEIITDIQNMQNNMFDKFSEANNSLDTFYQKIGFEWGKMKESLKEDK